MASGPVSGVARGEEWMADPGVAARWREVVPKIVSVGPFVRGRCEVCPTVRGVGPVGMQVCPGAMEVGSGLLEVSSGAMAVDPGRLEVGPGAMKVSLSTKARVAANWSCCRVLKLSPKSRMACWLSLRASAIESNRSIGVTTSNSPDESEESVTHPWAVNSIESVTHPCKYFPVR